MAVSAKKRQRRKPVKTSDGIMVYCGFTKLADPKKLKPHPENVRTHPPGQLALLAEVIEHTGWRETITVSKRSGLVTRGHARLATALEKGWKQVPVDEQTYASAEMELADLLADTRIQEFSNLDDGKLRGIIVKMQESGANLRTTGLDQNVIDNILLEYRRNVELGLIQPGAAGQGDVIRQAILVYDEKEFARFSAAITAIEKKRQCASVSELCLELLRERK